MKLLLEDFVPYDQSVRWRIHDAYYMRRGTAAWTENDIPHLQTSNFALARQHARFLLQLVSEMESSGTLQPDEEVTVLEIGCGLGRFASNFVRALQTGLGRRGRELVPRLRYLLSDYSEATVREAIQTPALSELVVSGVVVPALFDFRKPQLLTTLDDAPIRHPVTAVLANYICCISPVTVIRKVPAGFFEQRLRIEVELAEERSTGGDEAQALLEELLQKPTRVDLLKDLLVSTDWRGVHLEDRFQRPIHAEVIRATLKPHPVATLVYPSVFLELLRDIEPLMKSGGIALVIDFGSGEGDELQGLKEGAPRYYGNTMNHAINFSVFDAFSAASGLAMIRSRREASSLQIAAFRFGSGIERPLTEAFRRSYGEHVDGDALADFGSVGLQACRERQFDVAVRFLRRCLKFDPQSIELLRVLGAACVDGRYYRLALRYLKRGARLDHAKAYDFDFELGRVWFALDQPRKALRCYRSSLEHFDHPATHCNAGLAYEALGQSEDAKSSYRRALELDPARELPMRRLKAIEESTGPAAPQPGTP